MSTKKQSLAVLLALCSPWLPAGARAQTVTQAIELQSQFVDISGPNAGNSAGILSRDNNGAILKTFNDPVTGTIRPYNGALALGNAVAWYNDVVAIGMGSAAGNGDASASIAIGKDAGAFNDIPGTGFGQIAIGLRAEAKADKSIAVGVDASALQEGSVAPGAYPKASAPNPYRSERRR